MVFPSIPSYLDPSTWQQQQQNHPEVTSNENPQFPSMAPPQPATGSGSGAASTRPISMAERARQAKIPQPEAALKCPRCESTNTKFCYFNNYSLTQPRHFCKTCRRYWTRGGSLRNVPVGGGCRRNKRSKGSTSKSPVSTDRQSAPPSSTVITSNTCNIDSMIHIPSTPQLQLPYMNSIRHLSDYKLPDVGLNFGEIHPTTGVSAPGGSDMEFGMGGNSSSPVLSAGLVEHWRMQQMQQFPFMTGLEPPSGLYPFEGEGGESMGYGGGSSQFRSKPSNSGISQLASVKAEENQGLNLSRQFLGNEQFWGGNAWTDLSGFNSSSASQLL